MGRYLVTGGAGFVGATLATALIEHGHDVCVLDDLSSGRADRLPAAAKLVVGDVCDPDLVTGLCDDRDGCFHLAAVASVDRTLEEWTASHRVNAGGAVAVFEAARRVGGLPVVYASSAAVYGDADRPVIDETTPTRPISPYGADKLGNELHAAVASRHFNVPTAGLRFFNIYGPNQDAASRYAGVISIFLARAAAGQPLQLHGDGGQERDFIFVDDAVAALIAAMNRPQPHGAVLNICTGVGARIRDIAAIVRQLVGRRAEIVETPERVGDIRRSVGDGALAAATIGFKAEIRVADGLERLVSSLTPA